MTNRQKRKKRVAEYKATPAYKRARGNFDYCCHLDQGGRHGGLADGTHDWQEGVDNYYDNHTMKGHSGSCRAYNRVGMEYDI